MWKGLLEIRINGRILLKKSYKGKGSLIEWEERGGLNAKRPLIPFLPTQNRGGRRLTGGGQSGRSGLRGWPWTGGKRRGGYGEPIPGLTSSYGGAQRRGDGSRRRRAGVAAAAALRFRRRD